MIGKAMLALGVLGILLGGGVTVVSFLLLALTNGRTSWEEAMFGIIPGILVFLISLVLAVIGLVLVIKNRKKA